MLLTVNTPKVLRTMFAIAPYVGWCALAVLGFGLWLGLLGSPPDYQQGEHVRIMYVHVPSAYLATSLYFVLGVSAVFGLISQSPLAPLFQRAVSPIGACFTLTTLLTGAIWGKPTWGTWWVWDARLTSVLVLLLFYCGHLLLVNSINDARRAAVVSQILLVVGTINLPIVKFSVDWWHSLHQPASLIRLGGPRIDPSLLTPLLVMFLAATLGAFWLVATRFETTLVQRRGQSSRKVRQAAPVSHPSPLSSQ